MPSIRVAAESDRGGAIEGAQPIGSRPLDRVAADRILARRRSNPRSIGGDDRDRVIEGAGPRVERTQVVHHEACPDRLVGDPLDHRVDRRHRSRARARDDEVTALGADRERRRGSWLQPIGLRDPDVAADRIEPRIEGRP